MATYNINVRNKYATDKWVWVSVDGGNPERIYYEQDHDPFKLESTHSLVIWANADEDHSDIDLQYCSIKFLMHLPDPGAINFFELKLDKNLDEKKWTLTNLSSPDSPPLSGNDNKNVNVSIGEDNE
jgi:hypothetical protein